jgi:hypothetical protein
MTFIVDGEKHMFYNEGILVWYAFLHAFAWSIPIRKTMYSSFNRNAGEFVTLDLNEVINNLED